MKGKNICESHKLRIWQPSFTTFIFMFIKFFWWKILEFLGVWVPPFNFIPDVGITHKLYFFSSVIYCFMRGGDGVYITSKGSELMYDDIFTIPYHAKWGVVVSNALCSLHLYIYSNISASQQHFFLCWLLSRRPTLTMLWMILLCLSFFTLIHDASLPVVSMEMLKSSTRSLVTSVEFYKAPS